MMKQPACSQQETDAGAPSCSNETREEIRKRKLENERRRSGIWASEAMEPQKQLPPLEEATHQTPPSPHMTNPKRNANAAPSGRRRLLGSFLEEKQMIASRSLRRFSSRRSQLSSSSHHREGSRNTIMSEKASISERSNRRIKAREAARRKHGEASLVQQDEEFDLSGLTDPSSKAGMAETILPTVNETEQSLQSDSSESAPPSVQPGMAWHAAPNGVSLVTAVVVSDEEDQSIIYAAEVEEKSGCRERLPALLSVALVCLVLVLIVLVVLLTSNSESSSTGISSLPLTRDSAPPGDQDDPTPPNRVPSTSPTPPPPSVALNNGRPASSGLNDGRPTHDTRTVPSSILLPDPSSPPSFAPSLSPSAGSKPGPVPSKQTTAAPTTTVAPFPSTVPATWPSSSPSLSPTKDPIVVIGKPPTVRTSPTFPWVNPVNGEITSNNWKGNGNGNSNGNSNGNNNGNNGRDDGNQ